MTRIKERNELAKQILVAQVATLKTDPSLAVRMANRMMYELYGDESEPEYETEPETAQTPIVSIAEQDGQTGVRLCVGDVDIFIEAHDLDWGKYYEWPGAINRLKEVGKTTFNLHQAYMVMAFQDEINAKMREIGGEELEDYYWSSTEAYSGNAWVVYFSGGTIYNAYKNNSFYVRPVAAFKH